MTYLSPAAGVTPRMLVDSGHGDAVEPAGIVDEHAPSFGQDRVVRGVPRHPEPVGHTSNGEVLDHDPFQRPPQSAPRQFRPWLSGTAGVLAPHVPAAGAPIAPDRDQQGRRPPPERLVCQPPGHAVVRYPFASAPTTPARRVVGIDDSAREDSAIWLESLPMTSSPSSSRRVNVVRSGQAKVASGTSRPSAIRGMSRCRHAYRADWFRMRQRQNSVSCPARALPWL